MARLRARDRQIEVLEGSGRQGGGDEAETFASAGFEDPGDEKTVQEIGLRPFPVLPRQAVDVGVLPVGAEDQSARRHVPVHLGEMLQLFAREIDHRRHELRAVGVVRQHVHRASRGLALAVRVVLQERIEVLKNGLRPGRGCLDFQTHSDDSEN